MCRTQQLTLDHLIFHSSAKHYKYLHIFQIKMLVYNSVGIVYRYCNIYWNGSNFSISILMLELLISGVLNIWYTSRLIIHVNDNDRKYKHIVNYYLDFNENYNDDENIVGKLHKTITWLDCYCSMRIYVAWFTHWTSSQNINKRKSFLKSHQNINILQ